MGNILVSLTPWRSFTQISLAGAFTMVALFRGCGKRLPPFPSIDFFLCGLYLIAYACISFL